MRPKVYSLRPWTEVLRPHDDIVAGKLEMSTYAADLGAVDRDDPNTPWVYRDPREFFRTTYPTRNLRRLLADILGVMAGGAGDRVIQLRTPFGGGKTHALLALYHLIKSREKIDQAHLSGLPDPGPSRVAILSGLDLDPHTPRQVDGLMIRTLWGELAFRIGGQPSYEKVRIHDETGSAPSGNVLRPILSAAPSLVLLDEVLVYVERAGGKKGDDPLRRQVTIFLQALTEVVRNLPNGAMVYSLQASAHEAAGDEALLQELDHLVSRVDAKREPVSNEEVRQVVQRRLFPIFGEDPLHEEVAREVAREHAIAYRRLREAYAETDSERRAASQESERYEQRIIESYPFQPDLLDLMYHRWGSLPSYQRTRGALQFLAAVVHALWANPGSAQPLIGAGDVPFQDEQVRGAFFSQVGERERYSSVLAADITGSTARSREVDRRVGADSPTYERLRVGTRCATAAMLYSFGAREGEERGVLEAELIQSLVSPDFDRNLITTALHDLREQLLYLHYTGRRYRFEPKANLNLLISEETKKWQPDEVIERVRKQLEVALSSAGGRLVLWPPESGSIPDRDPVFWVVYLGPAWTDLDRDDALRRIERLIEERASGRREYRNGLAFAVPGRGPLDQSRNAARMLLAIDSLLKEVKAKRLNVEREQVDDLAERQHGAAADLAGSVQRLYEQVVVPIPDRDGGHPFVLEGIDLRAQLSGGRDLHGRILEALRKHVFDSLTPSRLSVLAKLGTEREFVACEDLVNWFYSYFDFPKLINDGVLRSAIARGTAEVLGYVSGAHTENGTVIPSRPELVRFGGTTSEDEIDLGTGSFLLSPGLASTLQGKPGVERIEPKTAPDTNHVPVIPAKALSSTRTYRVRVQANAAQLFRILPALQNLAEKSSRFVAALDVRAEGREPFDKTWLRNAVEEHLDEAGVDVQTELF